MLQRISRADYDYTFDTYQGRPIIYIVDQDRGGMSVTNDIENVIREIEVNTKTDLSNYIILYRDSEGNWDGWRDNDYLFLDATNSLEAAEHYIILDNKLKTK